MTTKESILAILDDCRRRVTDAFGSIPGPALPSTDGPRGALEIKALKRITDEISNGGLGLDPDIDEGQITYRGVLAYLETYDEAPEPPKRDTRRQDAKRLLDRFLDRGWLKRDGDLISMP